MRKSKPIVSRIRRSRQMMILPGDSKIYIVLVPLRQACSETYLVIWSCRLFWILDIVRRSENLF